MKRFNRFAFLLPLFSCIVSGTPSVTRSIVVIDSVTGKSVDRAQLSTSHSPSGWRRCDSSGRCDVVPGATGDEGYRLTAPGYDTVTVVPSAFRDTGASPDTVRLHPAGKIPSLQKIVVKGMRSAELRRFSTTSLVSFDNTELLATAGTGKDINRLLALNASIVSMGVFNDNGIMVRGGVMNENAYVIDGIIFDNINHYTRVFNPGGSFGFIDMDMVERLDLYTGDVPAGLPSRSSSVIDISLRSGSADSGSHRAEVDVLGAGVASEGPLFYNGGTYTIGFRLADMSFLNYFISESGTPRHADEVRPVY